MGLSLTVTPAGAALLAILSMFAVSIILAIRGTFSLDFLNMPTVAIILITIVLGFWRIGVALKEKHHA